jgi:WD40 repeat protein
LQTGKEQAPFNGFFCAVSVAFSPDGKTLASEDSKDYKLWGVVTRKERTIPRGNDFGLLGALTFSPDGKTLATVVGSNRMIKLWDVATAKEKTASFEGGTGIVGPLAFSPDGKTLAAGNDGMIKLWSLSAAPRPK